MLFNACSKHNSAPNNRNGNSARAENNLVVYAASENGKLYAFDANSGSILWTFALNASTVQLGQLSSPAYSDSMLYVGSTDQNIYAVNANTGKEVWHYPTNSTPGFFYSSPVVADGVVYLSGYEQRFYALDAKTGQLKWQRDFPRDFQSSPTFDNGTLFTASNDGTLYALNPANGATIWSTGAAGYNSGFDYSVSSPAVKNGVVYSLVNNVAEASSLINELNTADGTAYHGVYAEFDMPSLKVYWTSPVIDDTVAFFAARDSLYAVKTGDLMFFNKRWSFGAGGTIYSSPTFDDSTVYVGCNDGYLYAVNKLTGALRWKYNSQSPSVVSSPVVVNGVLFFGCDNRFIALNSGDGTLKWQTADYIPFTSSPVVLTKQGIAYHGSISGMTN
ncbi:MAG TPA: PQQ-binding-like beta-propeller repeat protein [Puia sp.]|nr:PQQ-binding-like beta-propeller repeat protein [Puia sp.]